MKKSKKYIKIISLLILTILISVIGYKVYSAATGCDINTYMAIYGDWKSGSIGKYDGYNIDIYEHCTSCGAHKPYLTTIDKRGYLGQTVGFPNANGNPYSDYGYVAYYPQVWCLSEGQINSTDTSLRVYGIIDVVGAKNNPTYTNIYYLNGSNKNVQTNVAGISEKRKAEAAFTMMVGRNVELGYEDDVTGVAQRYFIDTYKSFISSKPYLKNFIDDRGRDTTSLTTTHGGTTYNYSSYADAIDALNLPINTSAYGNLICKAVSQSASGLTFKTVVQNGVTSDTNGFNMSSNSSLVTGRKLKLTKTDGSAVEYTIRKDNDIWFLYNSSNIKKGRLEVGKGNIWLTDEMSVSKVEFTTNYDYIHGVVYLIGGSDTQTRAISKGEWTRGTYTSSETVDTVQTDVDVSMQKYIMAVNDVELTSSRANMKSATTETNTGHINSDDTYKQAAKGNQYQVVNSYKNQNQVPIIAGDTVTYKISIYNNGNTDATNFRIEDRLPNVMVVTGQEDGKDIKRIDTICEVESVKIAGGADITDQITTRKETQKETQYSKFTGTYTRIVYNIDRLEKGKNLYLEVKLSFNTTVTGKDIVNSAFLICSGNKTSYRTVDRDYIELTSGYQVSLEKFVSKLNGKDVTDRSAASEAEAKSKYRFNDALRAENDTEETYKSFYSCILEDGKKELNNLHFTKYNSAVEVQENDKVTFTIRLRNTGSAPVKVTRIYDTFKFDESSNNDYNGTKLVYDVASGITGNGGGRISDPHYGNDNDNKNKNLDRYLIEFDNPTLIAVGSYVDVTINYTVKVSSTTTKDSLRYINKAKILNIENRNNISVTDSDGSENNADTDFLITKKYSVSLEKYISAVTSGGTTTNTTGRDGKRYNNSSSVPTTDTVNKNTHKINNKVPVKIGDIVTFTIKLTNTGSTSVKVKEIYDSYRYNEVNGNLVYGLKYISGITGYNEDGTALTTYNGTLNGRYLDDVNNDNKNLDRYKITFENASLIGPNKSVYVKIKFEVYATDKYQEDQEEISFFNKAAIVKIQNENNIDVQDSDGTANNADMDWALKTKLYQVSLEKYVARVNNLTNITPSTNRENHPIYNQDGFSKENNPVKVLAGDTINYTIKITNTGIDKKEYGRIRKVVIKDAIPNWLSYSSCSSENVTVNDSNNTFTYEGNINVGEFAKFTIVYTVDNDVPQGTIIRNTATISKIFKKIDDTYSEVNDNDGTGNNTDSDWIQIKATAVALQKYITKVESPNGEVATYNDRHDHRFNSYSEIPEHKQDFKLGNNRVKVEPGDIVTFTIKLQNTGELPVKISQIYDTYSWYTREGMRGTGLEYVQNSITGNGNSYDFTFGYNDENDKYDYYDKYLIEFKNPETIQPGSEKVVTIQFRVTSTIAGELEIWNKAGIVQIIDYRDNVKNLDFMKVEPQKDFDGPDNNYDTDFMMIQEYKVSLEKFITSVTDKDGANEVNYTDRTGTTEEDAKNTYRFNETANGLSSSVLHSTTGELKSGSTEGNNLHFYKHNQAVRAEAGDKVTFTIRLRNTGTTKVKVKEIYDSFRFRTTDGNKGLKLVFDETYGIKGNGATGNNKGCKITKQYKGPENSWTLNNIDRYLIEFDNPILINPGEHTDVTIRFSLEIDDLEFTKNESIVQNKAVIVSLENKNEVEVFDADGGDNNRDMDFIRTKIYKVSLQKIVHSVEGVTNGISSFDRWTSWESIKLNNQNKHNNPVTVSNGNKVTYAIKVRNDGETVAKNIQVQDTLPDGLDLNTVKIESVESSNNTQTGYDNYTKSGNKVTFTLNNPLDPGEENTIYVSVTVTEPNISLKVLKNTAEIIGSMKNRNDREVLDSTTDDNNDADYIQMKDITISGRVWNDKPSNKAQDNYDGLYKNEDSKLQGITVKLYRKDVNLPIAITTTNSDGIYTFTSANIDPNVITHQCERYIKGPYKCKDSTYGANSNHTANYWAGNYYSYYVVFEYDGIRYTSTTIIDNDNQLGAYNSEYNDSNAKEDNTNGRITDITQRTDFNNRFTTINNESGINYATKNENNYIPQSLHQYDSSKMAMQSSTNRIELTNNATREEQLQHINLGLRGKDIFDLELTSDVDNIKITVNGRLGEYKYSNKVNLRQEDLEASTKKVEDMANILDEGSNKYVDSQEQKIRKSDFNPTAHGYSTEQGVSKIEVTYKLTVHNTSPTAGTATKVVNYYDSKYTFVRAYSGNATLATVEGDNGSGYKSVIITTPAKKLEQADKMEIYVVYTLNTPINTTLSGLTVANPIPTYNMAEVFEYKTECGKNQTEYTRGLIDKDSAPGSANRERVRLTTNDSNSQTTVQYYFAANELDKLKYEDDTYATPTLYFVLSKDEPGDPDKDFSRKITGIVFEDKTQINSLRVKTGNGIKDADEVGVYGVTVQLIEQVDGGKLRAETTTDKNGNFKFEGFLPGNYIIRYGYGDREESVILNKAETGINGKSYNGEDFQATNNYKDVAELDTNKLDTIENFWYIYNENKGISTAWDNVDRRLEVSDNVTNFIDEQMTVLNNMRNGKSAAASEVIYNDGGTNKTITVQNIIDNTKMFADTKNILITVEKTEKVGSDLVQKTRFDKYEIRNMNFGIAEVPVTTIDLQKHIDSFNITDASGKNVIASMKKVDGNWEMQGDVIDLDSVIDVSIEDEKLQGARLEITYAITANMNTEVNFDGTANIVPTMTGIVDFVNNNLSYNPDLGDNSKYWEVTTHDEIKECFAAQIKWDSTTNPEGTVDPEGTKYTTIVKAKSNNPLLLTKAGTGTANITLEKILSSTDATLEQIITSTVDVSEYDNIVEITGFDYSNTTPGTPDPDPDPSTPDKVMRDRIRNKYRYIIIPGVQYDNATSEIITIHPPTGDSGISTIYYIIAVFALAVFAIGVYGVKKFVVKK